MTKHLPNSLINSKMWFGCTCLIKSEYSILISTILIIKPLNLDVIHVYVFWFSYIKYHCKANTYMDALFFKKWTPLHLAATDEDIEFVDFLLRNKADVHAVTNDVSNYWQSNTDRKTKTQNSEKLTMKNQMHLYS